MANYWYALHSHPNKEDVLAGQLKARGFVVFYPRIRVSPVNPRARKIKPYFPGYLFIHVDLVQTGLSVFEWMPFTTGLVNFGGEPATVPDALIHAIRNKVLEIEAAGGESLEAIQKGDVVTIQEGAFSGYEAIFDTRLPGRERVRILLKMLNNRSLPLELDADQVYKKKNKQQR